MENLAFLEHIATHTFHHQSVIEFFNNLPQSIQAAILNNEAEEIKRSISNTDYYANEDDVVQIAS